MKAIVILLATTLCSARAGPVSDCPPCKLPTDCEVYLLPSDGSDPCACPTCPTQRKADAASDTACEIKGQVYTECGSACPPTCTSPDSSDYCTKVCVKGCQCPEGTVLNTETYECMESSKCECPPECSKDFCTTPGNERALCTIPGPARAVPSCTGKQCQITFCSACYFDEKIRRLPTFCEDCGSPVSSATCLRRWANCVGMRDQQTHRKPDPSMIIQENFKCYKYPCQLRER